MMSMTTVQISGEPYIGDLFGQWTFILKHGGFFMTTARNYLDVKQGGSMSNIHLSPEREYISDLIKSPSIFQSSRSIRLVIMKK